VNFCGNTESFFITSLLGKLMVGPQHFLSGEILSLLSSLFGYRFKGYMLKRRNSKVASKNRQLVQLLSRWSAGFGTRSFSYWALVRCNMRQLKMCLWLREEG